MPQIVKTADLGTFEFADSWGPERIESFLADKRDAVRRAKALGRENPIKRETEKALLRAKLLRLKAERRMVEDDLAKEYVTETLARQQYPVYDAFAKLYENVLPNAGPPSAGVRYLLGGAPRAATSLPSLGLSLIPTETTQGWSRGLDAFAQRAAEAVKPATYELGVQDSPGHGFGLMLAKGAAEMPYYIAAGGSARGILGALAKRVGPSGLGGRTLGRVAGSRTATTAIGSHPMIAQEHRQEGRARGVEMPYWAALTAIPSSIIETISTGKMLSRTLPGAGRKALGKAGGRIPQGVKDFSGMAVREGLEEAAQEAIAIKTPELAGAAPLSPKETLSRIGSAFAVGGILGGTVGGLQSASLNRRNTKTAKAVYEQLGKDLYGSRTFRTLAEETIANTKDLDDEYRSVLHSAMKKASKGEEATDRELIGFYNLVKSMLGNAYNFAGLDVKGEGRRAVKEIEQEKAMLGSALELFKRIERNQGAGKIESPVEEAGEGSSGGSQTVAAGVSGEVQVPTGESKTQEGPTVYGYRPENAQDAVNKRNALRPDAAQIEVAEEEDPELSSVLRGVLEETLGIKIVPFKAKKDGKKDDGPDAFVEPAIANTIFISTEKRQAGVAHNPVLSLIGHEATHVLKLNDPDTYRELKGEIYDLVNQGYGTQRLINRYKRVWKHAAKQDLDDDAAFEEFVADFVADSFVDPRFWDKLSDTNPTVFSNLAEKVYDYLGKVRERIFDLLQNRQLAGATLQRSTLSAALEDHRENVEKARTVIANALLRYQKRMKTAKYAGERKGPLEDTMFSLEERVGKRDEAYLKAVNAGDLVGAKRILGEHITDLQREQSVSRQEDIDWQSTLSLPIEGRTRSGDTVVVLERLDKDGTQWRTRDPATGRTEIRIGTDLTVKGRPLQRSLLYRKPLKPGTIMSFDEDAVVETWDDGRVKMLRERWPVRPRNARYSPNEPLWRSRLKDTVAEMDFGKDKAETAQSWKGKLAKWAMGKGLPPGRGISSEEVEASGLSDWLDSGMKYKITREHVLAYLEENTPWLEESVKGDPEYDPARIDEWREELIEAEEKKIEVWQDHDGSWAVLGSIGVPMGARFVTEDEAVQWWSAVIRQKYEAKTAAEIAEDFGDTSQSIQFPQSSLRTPGGRNYIERLLIANPKMGTGTFTHGHWPDDVNVMAHSRSQSFDLPNGELLHLVDEAQSDLHTEGRKRGYLDLKKEYARIEKLRADLEVAKQKEDELWDKHQQNEARVLEGLSDEARGLLGVSGELGLNYHHHEIIKASWDHAGTEFDSADKATIRDSIPEQLAREFLESRNQWAEVRLDHNRIRSEATSDMNKPVPDMPWKKTWARTVFRRELRAAVDKGADWFAWTTGKTQRDRYNLSKRVSKLVYEPAKGELTGYNKTGHRMFREGVPEAKMVSYVGKGVAEKLLNAPVQDGYQVVEGEDLEVGGMWTTALYDQRYVSDVKKLIKGTGQTVQSRSLFPDVKVVSKIHPEEGFTYWTIEGVPNNAGWGTKEEAEGAIEGISPVVHAVRLTPEVNERFGTAQTLFSPGETKTQTLINKFNRTRLVTATEARGLLGDQFPEYLKEVIAFMSRQRKKLDEGKMTVRDVAKAYVMTLGSIQAQWQQEVLIEEKTGFTAPVSYTAKNDKGQTMLRPEEAVAAWLGTDIGQRALNDIEKGIVNIPAWNRLVDLRNAYGQHQLDGAVAEQRTQLNLHDIQQVTKEINDAKNDPEKLDVVVKKLAGVRNAKSPFLQALVGVGAAPTIDAVEFNFWLTGQGNIRHLNTSKAKFARELKANIKNKRISGVVTERISKKIKALAKEYSSDHGIPSEHAAHIIHHWLWDRAKGTETPHTGMMEAMEKFSPKESFKIKARSLKKEFETNHAVDIVGQSAKNVGEVAALAQIFRDPRKEVFRWIFTKKGKVVGQYAATSRMVDGAWPVASGDTYESMSAEMAALGADGYYIQHNHPTGDPDPSMDDIRATRQIAVNLAGFKGHIVINHDKYVVINSFGEYTTHDVPRVGTKPDPTKDYRGELRILNRDADVPAKVVEMAKEMQVHRESDLVQYFVVNVRLRAVALAESTLKDFLEDTVSQFHQLRTLAKEEGGRHVIAYYGGLSVAFLRKAGELVDDGYLLDGVKGRYHAGNYRSVREHMWISPPPNRFFGVPQPTTPDTSVRLSPAEADVEYLKAVEDGDMAKAQAMVDEAAKKAGYDIGPLHHGTQEMNITVFDPDQTGRRGDPGLRGAGIYTSSSKYISDYYSKEGRYGRGDKPETEGRVYKLYGKGKLAKNEGEVSVITHRDIPASEKTRLIRELGYDGVITDHGYGGTSEILFFNPEQVKSADPVTRDDQGNVIPLSRRFDAATEDIRFSPTEADVEYANAVREGDTDKAERMLALAAKDKGFNLTPFFHSGTFDVEQGDYVINPWTHFGSEDAARDRIGGKYVDDLISEAEIYPENGRFFLDNDDFPTAPEDGFATEEAAREHVFEQAQVEVDNSELDSNLTKVFLKEGKYAKVPDLGTWPIETLVAKLPTEYQLTEAERERVVPSKDWDALAEVLVAKGLTGLTYVNNVEDRGSTSYIVLDPKEVKSAEVEMRDDLGDLIPLSKRFDVATEDIRYSPAEPVPVFYSKLQRGVDKVLPKAAKRMKKASLRKGLQRHGVTQKEMVWSGFDELLSGPEESVTRKEIEDALARNGMRIREAVYESELHGEALERRAAEIVEHLDGNNRWRLRGSYGTSMQTWATREEAMEEARIVASRMFDGQARHLMHTTRGGARYRELLLILPEREGVRNWYTDHWPEDRNVVVHVRFSEFVDRNGDKVLMIEEIQSDWAQAGRKVGYGRDRHWYVEDMVTGRDLDGPFRTEAEANEVLAKIENKIGTRVVPRRQTPVPDQPFKDSTEWTALAVKRMLRWAADNDFDRLAWTKGYQQFRRYGTDLIAWQKSGDGWKVHTESYYDPPASVLKLSEKEQVERFFQQGPLDRQVDHEVVNNREEFERFVAKKLRVKTPEQRKKLTERVWQKMNERDSGISAPRKEGMEGYYDGIVWTVVKKLARKTPQIRSLDLFEHPQYRWVVRRETPNLTMDEAFFRTRQEAEDAVKELSKPRYLVLNGRGGYVGQPVDTRAEAEERAREFNGSVEPTARPGVSYWVEENVQPVHSVEVAEGVKKDAKREGFSLFSPAEAVDAEYLKAVKADDMAKAQEMVDAAAIAAGYTIETFRGDSDDWDDFRNRRELGIFTSQDKDFADQYGKMKGAWRGVTRRFYVKGKVLDLERYDSQEWIREWGATFDQEDWVNRKTGEVEDPVDAVASGELFDWEGDWSGKMWTDLQASAREDGYDVLIAPDSAYGIENPVATIVLDDNGIKLADPVTYDDDGKVIPLSRRFDDTGYDVRYSPKEADEDYFEAVKSGNLGRVQDMVDRAARAAGFPRMELTHGTTHRFTVFNLSRANVENDLGAGFYFTNSPDDAASNYAGKGADLTARVERAVEQMVDDDFIESEFEEKKANREIPESMSLEEYIRKLAEEQVVGPEDREIKAYVKLNNPAILGLGQDETFLTYDIDSETGEESGTFVDFIRAFRDVAGAYEGVEEEVVVRELYEAGIDYDGVSMREAIAVMKESGGLEDAIDYDNNGESLTAEVIRQTIEEAGYDGIVDRTVFAKFGTGVKRGLQVWGMAGVNPDTIHVIAFNPHQIKSSEPITRDDQGNIIPLSQRFNEENPDYRYSPQEVAHSKESLAALDPENAHTERLKIKANIALIIEKFENEWRNKEFAVEALSPDATPDEKFDAVTDRKAATLTKDVGKVLAQIELVNQVVESGAMDDLVSNVEREKLRAIAYAVTKQSKVFEDRLSKLKYEMENGIASELEAAAEALMQDLPTEKAKTAYHESLADDLVRDYKAYLDKQTKGSKDRTLLDKFKQLLRDFSHKMRGDREAHQQIRTLFNHIALGNPKVTDAVLNDPDITKNSRTFYKWLEENGVIAEALQMLYLTNKGDIGYAQDLITPGPKGGASVLASYASLVSRIKTLRGLERKATQTKHEVQQFAADFFGGQVQHGAKGVKGPSGKRVNVTPKQMADAYFKARKAKEEHAERARQIDKRYKLAEIRFEGHRKAIEFLENLTNDPTYKEQRNRAIELNGWHFSEEMVIHGNTIHIRLPGEPVEKPVIIKLTANGDLIEAEADKLREVERKLASWITDAEANKYTRSREEMGLLATRKTMLREVQDRLNPRWSLDGDVQSIPLFNLTSGVAGKAFSLPYVRLLFELPQELADSIPGQLGRDFKRAYDDLNYLNQEFRAHFANTKFKLVIAIDEAIKSHGFKGVAVADHFRIWEKAVLEPILNSEQNSQSITRMKVGAHLYSTELYGFKETVTKEDIAAAKAMHAYETKIHQLVSNTLGKKEYRRLNNPLRIIQDEKLFEQGGVVTRAPIQTGRLTMSRRMQKFASEILGSWWDESKIGYARGKEERGPVVADPKAARELHEEWLMDTDADGTPRHADFFNYILLGYINEGNPELTVRRKSEQAKIYDHILREMMNGKSFLNTEEVVERIATLRGTMLEESDIDLETRKRMAAKVLFDEIEKVTTDMLEAHHPFLKRYSDDSVNVNVQNPKDSFNKARGRLLGPSILYDHALSNDEDMKALQNSALNHFINRAVDATERVITGFKEEAQRLEADLKEMRGRMSYIERLADKEYRAKRAKLMGLNHKLSRSVDHLNQLRAIPRNDDESLGRRRGMAFVRGTLASTVLSPWLNILSPAADYFSTNVLWNPLMMMHLAALQGIWLQPTKFFAKEVGKGFIRMFRNAGLDIARRARDKKVVGEWVKSMTSLAPAIAEFEALRNEAVAKGLMKRPAIQDQMEALRRTGRIEGFVNEPTTPDNRSDTVKFVEKAAVWFERRIGVRLRGWRDEMELVNVVGQMQAVSSGLKSMKKLAQEVYARREADGVPEDHPLTPEEMRMIPESFERWRDLFGSVAAMETVFADYYQKTKGLSDEEAMKLPLGRDEAETDALTRAVIMMGAAVNAPSLTPVITQRRDLVGGAARTLTFLMGWANRARYQVSRTPAMSSISKERDPEILRQLLGLWWMVMGLAILAGFGALPNEFKEWLRKLITGQPSAQIRLRQLIRRGDAWDVLKYGTASYAANMPMIGNRVASILGTRTYSYGSLFDMSDHVFMLGAFRNMGIAATKAWQTGELVTPMKDYARRQIPNLQFFINRWDAGDADARSASRVLRAIAPSGTEVASARGGYYKQTPMTMAARHLMAAGMTGDTKRIAEAYEALVQAHMNAGKSREDAEDAADRQVAAMSPERRAFGRYLTPGERSRVFEAALPEEKALIERASRVRETIKRSLGRGVTISKPRGVRFGSTGARAPRKVPGLPSLDLRGSLRLPALTLD